MNIATSLGKQFPATLRDTSAIGKIANELVSKIQVNLNKTLALY